MIALSVPSNTLNTELNSKTYTMMYRQGLLYLLIMLFSSCRNPFDFGACDGEGVANGLRVEYFDNGDIKSQVEVENCRGNGLEIEFHPNRRIKEIGFVKTGSYEGDKVIFDTSGALVSVKRWRENKLVEISHYDDSLNVISFNVKESVLKMNTDEKNLTIKVTNFKDDNPNCLQLDFVYNMYILRGCKNLFIFNLNGDSLCKLEGSNFFPYNSRPDWSYQMKNDSFFINSKFLFWHN